MNDYLYKVDKNFTSKKLDYFIYDSSVSYIKIQYIHGIVSFIKKSPYYRGLSAGLKTKLIKETLEDYYNKFFYFFNDF